MCKIKTDDHRACQEICNGKFITFLTRPQTYDGYSALHTQYSMYLNWGILSIEYESFPTEDSPIKIHGAESGIFSVRC